MIDHNGAWLPSIWLGIPVIAICVLLCIAALVLLARHSDGAVDFWIIGWVPVLTALALVIGSGFGYWPYQGDYHRLQPIAGTVQAVDTRFLAASQYVVVTYQDGPTVRCDDSRCATVRPGDTLRLLCTKEFEYGAVNGWGCRWGQQ